MRVSASDVPHLPGPVALRDRSGEILAKSPEWRGPGPGTLTYPLGQAELLVASDRPNQSGEWAVDQLLHTIQSAAAEMTGPERARAEMLAAALGVAAGRRPTDQGTLADLKHLTEVGVAARCQAEVHFDHDWPADPVAAPAALAVALVQMAVNLQTHEDAHEIRVSLEPGPTFRLSCPLQAGATRAHVKTSRAAGARNRWGAAYCRHIADALGGSISDPILNPSTRRREIFLGLGATRLALPLARVRDGRIEEATPTWYEETRLGAGDPVSPALSELLQTAASSPATVVAEYPFRARLSNGEGFLMLVTNDADDIVREVVNGLFHERALWHGREPAATRVYALSWILAHHLGAPWQPQSPLLFTRSFDAASAALGVSARFEPETLRCPDGRVAAYAISELGGSLEESAGRIRLMVSPAGAMHPLAALLRIEDGAIDLTPAPS